MKRSPLEQLSRRERQIMDVIYREGEAAVGDVLAKLPDPPGYSAVRAQLRILERKGHLEHRRDGNRYVYSPILPRNKASRSALENLLGNFFGGSREKLVAALLDDPAADITAEELDGLSELIERARKEGR